MLICEFISEEHRGLIEDFQCSDEVSVEIFLKEQALRLHQNKIAITRLFLNEQRELVGYFTIFNDLVMLNREQRQKHDLVGYPRFLPALKLHYLGVDLRHRNQGLGNYILHEALDKAWQISKDTGCVFLTLESLPSAAGFYYKNFFKRLRRVDGYIAMFFNLSLLGD